MLKLRKDSLKMYIEDNEEKNQNKLSFWKKFAVFKKFFAKKKKELPLHKESVSFI